MAVPSRQPAKRAGIIACTVMLAGCVNAAATDTASVYSRSRTPAWFDDMAYVVRPSTQFRKGFIKLYPQERQFDWRFFIHHDRAMHRVKRLCPLYSEYADSNFSFIQTKVTPSNLLIFMFVVQRVKLNSGRRVKSG